MYGHDISSNKTVLPGFESCWRRNSAHDCTTVHSNHYHPFIVSLWPKYIERDVKDQIIAVFFFFARLLGWFWSTLFVLAFVWITVLKTALTPLAPFYEYAFLLVVMVVVGCGEGAVYLASPGRPTDIGLQLGR